MNKIIQALRDGMISRLVTGSATLLDVPAGQTGSVEVPLESSKILIKSIEVKCNKNTRFRVYAYETSMGGDIRYDSDEVTGRLLDVLDYAYVDQDGQKKLYMRIENLDAVSASYTIEIRGLQLK